MSGPKNFSQTRKLGAVHNRNKADAFKLQQKKLNIRTFHGWIMTTNKLLKNLGKDYIKLDNIYMKVYFVKLP
jgi:hypothetical protein